MDDGAVFAATAVDQVCGRIAEREARWNRPHFAEQYVDGREFNLSMLGGEVLPPAEIDFSALPDGQPWIVGQRAKSDTQSFEYHHTPRRFDFPPADQPLVGRMSELAVACWHLFGLRGFARVDFRCDRRGRPWILEINTNPCLERTSGFAAALEEAGIGYDGGIQRLVDDAVARSGPLLCGQSHGASVAT
jgi:D-alanine-D-alanine ligase